MLETGGGAQGQLHGGRGPGKCGTRDSSEGRRTSRFQTWPAFI